MEPTKNISPLPKAFLLSLVLIVFSLMVTILNQETNRILGIIPLVIMVGGMAWICIDYGKQMEGKLSFGNIFSYGFKGTALIAAIMGLWIALYISVLFPETVEQTMEMRRSELAKNGMSEAEIDRALTVGRKIAAPMGAVISTLLYLALGAIGSLIGANFAKKNPNPNPF